MTCFTLLSELDVLLASRGKSSACIEYYNNLGEFHFFQICVLFGHLPSDASPGDTPNLTKSVSPDKENEPEASVAVLSSSSMESKVRSASVRPSTIDEQDTVAGAAVCFTVGGTAVRRPTSSLKPPLPSAARVPHVSSGSQASSSSAGSVNARSNFRSEVHQSAVKPPSPIVPSPLVPATSGGPAVRGKGWVAGVSDSLGLALSGDDHAA